MIQVSGWRWRFGGWIARLGLKMTRLGNMIRHGRRPWLAGDVDDDDFEDLWTT